MGSSKSVSKERHVTGRDCHPSGVRKVLPISGERTLAYYNLLLAQEQARLVENSVMRVRQSLRETRALNEAELAADYDVLRLEVELANLEPNLLRAQNFVSESRREVGIELGLENGNDVRVAGALADIDLDDPAANSAANRQILEFSS